MNDRRQVSSSLSRRIVEYLRRRGHSQARIARMLGVSEPFVSLVKARERGLTLDHLERLSLELQVPLGAFLIAATNRRGLTRQEKEQDQRLSDIIRLCDKATEAILRSSAMPVRRRRAS